MIKPRKPDKIKPGTPHPTKAYTVRGFNGKWITTKSYHADRRRREKAAKEAKETKSTSKTTKSTSKKPATKGGSLTKRVSSALTKTSNKAGELLKVNKGALDKVSNKAGKLLKINKGDKGLVRGIKDTYKMGKDTRKSADALYKAGKITRQVYDKLVKGTKDFFGGVKESGKATRRVVNALKPGGKLVAQAKKFNGVNYDLIPKSIRGKLVKVSKDGGKSKTFKFDYSKIPENFEKKPPTRFQAPKVPDRKKVKKTLKTKIKDKVKSVKSNIKNTKPQFNKDIVNRPVSNLKLRLGKPNQVNLNPNSTKVVNPIVQRALQINKSLNPKSLAGGAKAIGGGLLQNAKGLGVGMGLDWAAQSLLDRTMRNMEGKQKMHINDYRALKDKRIDDLKSRATWWGGVKSPTNQLKMASKPQRVIGERGRTTGFIQPEQTGGVIGRRNEQYITREPKISYKPEKEVPPPQQGTDSTKKNETVDKVKVKNVEKSKNYWKAPMINLDKPKKKDKPKNKLKSGFSERQIKSQIRNLKRRNKASDRMKIKRLQALL